MNKIFALSDVYRDEKVKLTAEDDIEKTIGSIIMNRIINIAYKNLDLSEVEYEADKNLSILFLENISQANVFKKNLNYLLGKL